MRFVMGRLHVILRLKEALLDLGQEDITMLKLLVHRKHTGQAWLIRC